MIERLLHEFMNFVEKGDVEIYNEFSLQHELGIFLRNKLPKYKVQFERNAKFFGINGTIKHEIDIVVYDDCKKYAIELKYPLNGQYPEQMYSFIKDICFMEELGRAGFTKTYCLTAVLDKNFYSGAKRDGIYSFFRNEEIITGNIIKPTGKRDSSVVLNGEYQIKWLGDNNKLKYYILKVSG